MKIVKTRKVKTPERGTEGSAGIDFFIPYDYSTTIILKPGQDVKISSGIHVKVPKGYALLMMNKSGIASRKNLQVGACVVDEDYMGEVILHLRNIGLDSQMIIPGEKIVQGVLVQISKENIEVMETLEDLYDIKTERGSGAFGSTGEK